MLTPLDIQNKEFKKGINGYKQSDVDKFLDEVIVDYEKIYKENIELREKLTIVNDQINRYSEIEETLQNTLIVAQSAAEELKANAREKAEIIIREAEDNGKKIIQKSNEEVIDIKREYENIRKEISVFKTRFRTFLQSQLESVDFINDEKA